jgi:hypothetical protein
MSKIPTQVGRFMVSQVDDPRSKIQPIKEDSGYNTSSESDNSICEPPTNEESKTEVTSFPVYRSPYFQGQIPEKAVSAFTLSVPKDREEGGENDLPLSVLSTYQESVCTKFSDLLNLHRTTMLDIIEKGAKGEEIVRSLVRQKAELQLELKRALEDRKKVEASLRYDKMTRS